ncbi:hypothetical protein [Ruminococcus albus]
MHWRSSVLTAVVTHRTTTSAYMVIHLHLC